MTTQVREAAPVTYLAQADLLLLLSEMLSPPSSWSGAEERRFDAEELDELAQGAGLDRIPGGAKALRIAAIGWAETDREQAVAEHNRLFDGPMVCASNETIFVRRDKGAVLADIAGFYHAFGFEITEEFREKHDHLLAELQFTAMLLVLLARALEDGRAEPAEVTRAALRSFLEDHLGVWLGAFAERLEGVSELPYFVAVSRALAAGWRMLERVHEVEVPEKKLASGELPMVGDSGTPYECGMCEASVTDDSGEARPATRRSPGA